MLLGCIVNNQFDRIRIGSDSKREAMIIFGAAKCYFGCELLLKGLRRLNFTISRGGCSPDLGKEHTLHSSSNITERMD